MATENTRLLSQNGNGQPGRTREEYLELGDADRMAESQLCQCCCTDCGKSFVFGAFDGIIASLAIVSACVGGGVSSSTTLIVGFAALLSNSISMGISEYLSSKAHREFLQAEKRRELWEFKHYKEGEITEMINRFESRGMARKDAELVVTKMAQYENFFVGLMVSEELGLQVPEGEDSELLADAFVMFFSFALFGAIPVSFYALGPLDLLSDSNLFLVSSTISIIILVGLGMIKSTFSSSSIFYSALEALAMGLLALFLSYISATVLADLLL